jgi:hypothetical protein
MHAVRLTLRLLAFTAAALMAALAWYDYHHVYVPLQKAYAFHKANPPLAWPHADRLDKMFRTTYGQALFVHLAQLLERQTNPDTHSSFRLFLSGLLLRFHTTPDEQLALILHQGSWGAQTYGVANASLALLGKPLPSCTDYELATLVAIYRSPSAYTIGSDRLLRSTAWVLKGYRDGT